MKIWVGSDHHFGHRRIIELCPNSRPYKDVEEMDQKMIQEWNATVGPDDLVYHLGDVAFCNAQKAAAIVRSLNGRKILVAGNHDDKNLKDQAFRDCFDAVHI